MNRENIKHRRSPINKHGIINGMVIVLTYLFLVSWGNREWSIEETDGVVSAHATGDRNEIDINELLSPDTLVVTTATVILLIPSQQEIDSLINVWGEDKFYEVAYDENRKLSRVYGQLDETNTSYQAFDKSIIYLKKLNKTLKKSSFPYPWGVLDIKLDGSFTFKNTIEFLLD